MSWIFQRPAVHASLLAAALLAAFPLSSAAAGVTVRLDPASPQSQPFPSDQYARGDSNNNSYRRIDLPQPDCTRQPSSCEDNALLNTLDGFSLQPRIAIPFTGAIDPATVNSDTVYLLNQGDRIYGQGVGERVGINQIIWNPNTQVLVVQPDSLLREYSQYALVVTDGVRDRTGARIDTQAIRQRILKTDNGLSASYRSALMQGQRLAELGSQAAATVSVFTTQSVAADLQKIQLKIKASRPEPVDFEVGNGQSLRAVFATSNLRKIDFLRQTGTAPVFTPEAVPTWALDVRPGAVGRVAFGRYVSPNYLDHSGMIAATGTRTGVPQQMGQTSVMVEVFLPNGAMPPGGWPVVIFGHGFTDSMYGAPWAVAAELAAQGLATVAINAVGHGSGSLGSLNVTTLKDGTVSVPAGGRGFDQNGDGRIDSTEGVSVVAPYALAAMRDAIRQTSIDLMQLVRQIQAGVDVDGDGTPDLSKGRIYYAGQSLGGIYGTVLTAVEGSIRAAVLNVPGGALTEVGRLGELRSLVALTLDQRQPSRINLRPTPQLPYPLNLNFDENLPLRNEPPRVDQVRGAVPIQRVLDNSAWVQQAGNPVAYARYLRDQPLPGNTARPVIVQFAKGDETVPNPTTTALLRAGNLADRATYFRNDLAYALTGGNIPKNPHTFLTNLIFPLAAPYALAAQQQMALFLASDGQKVIDPDGLSPYFETPIAGPLPETLNFLP